MEEEMKKQLELCNNSKCYEGCKFVDDPECCQIDNFIKFILSTKQSETSRVTGVSDEEHEYYIKHGEFPEWSPYSPKHDSLPRTKMEEKET